MGDSPQPVPAPNPVTTAAAQTASNVNTAQANAALNNVNQVTPFGNLNYNVTGTTQISDGKGGTIDVPQYTATQTLNPDDQNILNVNRGTKGTISNIGYNEAHSIGDLLGTPVDLGKSVDLTPGAISQKLMDLGNARLQPELARQWNDRESTLMNRGIMPGTEGYQREQDAFGRQSNDAYNQLVLGGYGQEAQMLMNQRNQDVQTALAQRNQPINEISALLSGSQVSQPNFIGTPQSQVAPTNVAGITQDAFQNNMANAQMQNSYNNAMMGGLFGLGSAGLGMFKFSDRRLKTDIEKVGKTDEGTPIYSYRYKAGGPTEIGFMAQDIQKKVPEAVVDLFGLKAVNYKAAIAGGA